MKSPHDALLRLYHIVKQYTNIPMHIHYILFLWRILINSKCCWVGHPTRVGDCFLLNSLKYTIALWELNLFNSKWKDAHSHINKILALFLISYNSVLTIHSLLILNCITEISGISWHRRVSDECSVIPRSFSFKGWVVWGYGEGKRNWVKRSLFTLTQMFLWWVPPKDEISPKITIYSQKPPCALGPGLVQASKSDSNNKNILGHSVSFNLPGLHLGLWDSEMGKCWVLCKWLILQDPERRWGRSQ